MSTLEKTITLLQEMPETSIKKVYQFVQNLQSQQNNDVLSAKLTKELETTIDPFYSEENQARLLISKERMEKTGGTVHELIEVYDEKNMG